MARAGDLRRVGGAPALSDEERARIEALLDRLDPRVGSPGGVPGEVVLSPGRTARAAA